MSVIVFDPISILAMALFSCKVTQAVLESSEIVKYSGSISCAKEALRPKFLIL
jgi:hypothetical protein